MPRPKTLTLIRISAFYFFLEFIVCSIKRQLTCEKISSGSQVFRPAHWFDVSHPETLPFSHFFKIFQAHPKNKIPKKLKHFFLIFCQNEILCLIPLPHCMAAAGKSHGLSLKFIRWRLKAAVLCKELKVHSFNPHRKWAERLSDNVPPCLLRAYCIFLQFDLSPSVCVCYYVCESAACRFA